MKSIKKIIKSIKGQGLAEYGLILALISIVTVVAVDGIGDNVKSNFNLLSVASSNINNDKVEFGKLNDIPTNVQDFNGRNLITNSGNFTTTDGWNKGSIVTKNGYKTIEVSPNDGNVNYLTGEGNSYILNANSEYVFSGYLMSSDNYNLNNVTSNLPLHFQG